MDPPDDQYSLLQELLNMINESTYDPSYVQTETVKLCPKLLVNDFGSDFNPPFYYFNFLLSYLGNGLVLYIIFKYEKLNTVTNIFLLNLVLSNILFASSLPFWATYFLSQWVFGSVLCKMVSSAYFIGFYSSILFLTLMTFDRYLAVVHAVSAAKSRKRSYALVSSAVVWCVSILASLKELVFQNVWENPPYGLVCEETGYSRETMDFWRLVSYYQQFSVFFLLPLLMVTYCYVSITVRIMSTRMKEKCRAVKLIFIIIFTFFVCWTPYNVVILLQAVHSSGEEKDCDDSNALDYAMFVTRNIANLYCCISPVFYTFVGKKFQSHFRRILVKKLPCLRRHLSLSSFSTRSSSQKTPHSEYEC
ncbi:C-C chemokine receptor type 3-like [Entelurus aequoreus]|uniref:C-C chemokine receptor type 3-like n=1 Tax=Entelurus aequoreus TaxID=161455 RepID=UPI002B1E3058|nr:C-C chemokine receptor type 3-like [Entelurus aequoreus]XP_061925695.1 C-C chemokine receptor type 3-like [Entelurus aequoreus]XP_061926621.1 C-C chemokine receptor type 3-like [Entelurus aequoreus]XP_061926622.1 C-C chemokine receptor type 3-like [Entelurus aequoreus]